MNNKDKILAAVAACLLSSASLANYSMLDQQYVTGTAHLNSSGACKFKKTRFANAKYGQIIDNTTQDVFLGVLSADDKLLLQFSDQTLPLSDVRSSTRNQDYQRHIWSHSVAPSTLNTLIESGCSFTTNSAGVPVLQSVPSQNVADMVIAKKRAKQGDWLKQRQVQIRAGAFAATEKEKNCGPTSNYCVRTGALSNIMFTFKHKSSTPSSERLFAQ